MKSEPTRVGLERFPLWVVLILAMGLHSVPVAAQEIGRPIYDPESKSYFALHKDNDAGYWKRARELAQAKVYRGIRGRLAIVRSPQTHDFLRRNFKIKYDAWIGLRYWCRYRKLQWVTGDILETGQFSPWAAQWYRNYSTACGRGTATRTDSYMPVYYSPHKSGPGFTWQASGPQKGFKYYFIEYPAQTRE